MRFFEFKNEEAAGVGIVTKQNATVDVPVGGEYQNVKKLFPKKKKKTKEDNVQELVVKQQRPKIDVINNIATRKDNNPFPLSYKDTGGASSGGMVYITPENAKKFIQFYDRRAEDEQQLMIQALKSVSGLKNLFTNIGLEIAKIETAKEDNVSETIFINKMKSFIVENYKLKNFTEELGKLDPSTEIYVDMDGVLADFFGDWAKLMGVDSFRDIKDAGPALAKIRATDDFWLKLPLLPEAKKLLSLIKEVKGEYNICTSPLANDPNSEPHKREWIKKNLAFFPPKNIHITHDKPQFATTNDGAPNILIDDYGVNINAWEAAGGIGFKHKDHKFERTAKEIKQHMQEPVSEGAEITMWTNPEYQGADVDDKYYKKQPVKRVDVSKLTPFEPADKMDPKDNQDNMMKFVDKIIAGEKIKPIVIVPYEGKWLIVDGHHRYFAHIKAGVDKIRAVIADPKDLTWRDDVPESVSENFVKDTTTAIKLIKKYHQTGDEQDAFAAIKHGWNFIKNPKIRSIIVNIVKKVSTEGGYPEWNDTVAYIKKNTGIDVSNVNENFADGKKPGRKGLAKRSGVNTKASVSSLRKTAKSSSGEKQRMAHWMANMKAGKAKKKGK